VEISAGRIGPDAYPAQVVGGGSAGVRPFTAVSFVEGIAQYLGSNAKVYYEQGIPSLGEMADDTQFSSDEAGKHQGLNAEIFTNTTLSGKPALLRTDQHINFDHAVGNDVSQNEISARWTGYFIPTIPGDHLLFVQGGGEEGGSRLYLDDKIIIDNWDRINARIGQLYLPLSAGRHKIRLEYFVHGSYGGLRFGIIRPNAIVSPAAKALASRSDAVVVAVGFNPDSESEGGDRAFQLPPAQDELINQLATVNKNLVVVVTSGGGIDTNAWFNHVPSLLEAWYPGQEGGTALAQLIFGDYSPSGKLPISIERRWEDNAVHDSYYPKDNSKKVTYTEGVFVGYRHFDRAVVKPMFPFGYGLSYTTFDYRNLAITPTNTSEEPSVTVSFDLTNAGTRAGAEIAEVYVGEPHSRIPRPVKELKGFEKVLLQAAETRHVSVNLDPRAFSYYDVGQHRWTLGTGDFTIWVGQSAAQIQLRGNVTLRP